MDMKAFLPFRKNRVAIPCEKSRFLNELKKDILDAPSLRSNWPPNRTRKKQLSGVVESNSVFLSSGRLQNILVTMILRGVVIETNDRECEMQYRFVPCNTFYFVIAIVNYWVTVFIAGLASDFKYKFIALIIINSVLFGDCILHIRRTKWLLDEEIKKVVDKIGELNVLQKKALTLSPAALFSEIMEQFRVYEAVNCDHLEVLYYTLELLKNAEKSGVVVSHKDALNYLEMLLSGTSEEERCLSVKDDLDCVHMANLHKLKGLEAPVVILSYSGLYSKTADLRIEHGTEKTEGWIFNVSSEMNEAFIKTTYFNTTLFAQAEQLEAEALAAEDDRLIYVAATRARNVLIINNNRFYMKGDPGRQHVPALLLRIRVCF